MITSSSLYSMYFCVFPAEDDFPLGAPPRISSPLWTLTDSTGSFSTALRVFLAISSFLSFISPALRGSRSMPVDALSRKACYSRIFQTAGLRSAALWRVKSLQRDASKQVRLLHLETHPARRASGIPADRERNRQADAEPVLHELGDHGDGSHVGRADGRKRQNDEPHEEEDEGSVGQAAGHGPADQVRQPAAGDKVDGCPDHRDREVENHAQGRGSPPRRKRRRSAENAGGDRLGNADGRLRAVHHDRV